MKKISLFMIIILLIVSIIGCAQENEPAPGEVPEEEEEMVEEIPVEEYSIEDNLKDKITIVEEEDVLEEAREWFQQFNEIQEGAYVYQHPDNTYIKINLGERGTGGHGIHIMDYDEEAYPRLITIEEISPEEDEAVTQVITYPSVIIAIESDMTSQYEVQTSEGEALDLQDKLVWAVLQIPEENEKVDNPMIIKGNIIAFEGAFIVRILDDQEEIIHEEYLQADAGGPYWGNFEEKISYPQPETETGSLEIGEYSAKDGEYLLRKKITIEF